MSQGPNKASDTEKTAKRILWGQVRRSDRSGPDKDKVKFLKRVPFFENLNKRELEQISHILFERDYEDGEFVFELGQPGAALFIVASGEVSIEIPAEAESWTEVALIGKHSFFGELALLDETPRSASARAKKQTRVYALFRSDLDDLMRSAPHIAAHIYKALASIVGSRLKATNELIEKRQLKVAV